MNPQQVLGVKEFVGAVNDHLRFGYQNVTVEGEVSGFRETQKTYQFTLKEGDAQLKTWIFKFRLAQPIEDGMVIRVTGTPELHPQWGFSFNCLSLELAGEGELMRAFELLKAKLEAEGLFDPLRKRPLPQFPARVGVVTSKHGVVFNDFLKELNARWGGTEIVFCPVMVQGAGSIEQIVDALDYMNQLPDPVEVIALIRGGGSLEDLLSFNSEPVARAVAGSRTPIVVGVGHEPDISLADLVADVRASTPTQAARIIFPNREEIARQLSQHQLGLSRCMRHLLEENGRRLQLLAGGLEAVLRQPLDQIRQAEIRLRQFLTRSEGVVARQKENLLGLQRLFAAANPSNLLERGYSIAYSGGKILRDPAQVKAGDKLVIQLHKGKLGASADGK